MAVKITYFVHGTTVDNQNNISSGWSDTILSELGKEQSIKLKEQTKDKKFEVVFCSDLKRAVESAELTFEGIFPIIIDKRLRECSYGKYNGQSSDIVEPLQEKYIYERFPDGESYEDVKNRMAEFISFLKENYDNKEVAIVAHKAPQLALEVLLKNKSWQEAFDEDWRKRKAWQPGWEYEIK
jgi:alpha-ribazole phosphatase/probable phosphoglycerate mutase